jgi:hypothetical protein
MIERIGFGTAQVRPGTDRVEVRPGQRLTLGLGVTAGSRAELDGAEAFVWTNVGSDDPGTFRAVAMTAAVPSDAHQRAFEATLPPATPGTYIATGYVVLNGVQHWAQDYADVDGRRQFNLHNRLVFRVSPKEVDGLFVRQVPIDKANARADSTEISTIEDMLEESSEWYSLKRLADAGVNCVWVQVPYRLDVWDGIDAIDDAGSDYASNDWFAIDPQLSRAAQLVPAWDLDRQRILANDAMRRFVNAAHGLGMKVLSELAPNHVGHNYIFRDSFGAGTPEDVRRRDYGQMTVGAAQAGQVSARLAAGDLDETVKNYAEWILPQMYAGRYPDGTYNPFGAAGLAETYSPDWYGLWRDTKHLNHGGHAGRHIWYPRTEQNYRVLGYIGRAMLWSVTELGFDGFRIDHTYGMPFHFFEQTLPWVEAKARERRGGDFHLLLVHEDHDRKDYTARVGDVVQSKGYEGLLHALTHQDVAGVWGWYGDPTATEEFSGTGNHDEIRGSDFFPGNLLAYGNAVLTMLLMGGPMTMLAGDEYAEGQKLRFKAKGGIPTLWQLHQGVLPEANTNLAYWIGRGGQLRRRPQLKGANRQRLWPRPGSSGQAILACSRFTDDLDEVPLLVFNNLGPQEWATGRFELSGRGRAWLEQAPDAYYQVRDQLGFHPDRLLWSRPLQGSELLTNGLGIGLQSYQIQVLELQRLG